MGNPSIVRINNDNIKRRIILLSMAAWIILLYPIVEYEFFNISYNERSYRFSISSDGRYIAMGTSKGILKVWDIQENRDWDLQLDPSQKRPIYLTHFLHQGYRILAIDKAHRIYLWERKSAKWIEMWSLYPDEIKCNIVNVAFDNRDNELALGCDSDLVYLVRVVNPFIRHKINIKASINQITYGIANDLYIASYNVVIHKKAGKFGFTYKTYVRTLSGVQIRSLLLNQMNMFVTGSDGILRIWKTKDMQFVKSAKLPDTAKKICKGDKKYIIILVSNSKIYRYNTRLLMIEHVTDLQIGMNSTLNDIECSADGSVIGISYMSKPSKNATAHQCANIFLQQELNYSYKMSKRICI